MRTRLVGLISVIYPVQLTPGVMVSTENNRKLCQQVHGRGECSEQWLAGLSILIDHTARDGERLVVDIILVMIFMLKV